MTKNKVVIFGVLDTAELAHFYLTHDSQYEVVAFTLNAEFIEKTQFKGLPIIPFEKLEDLYPPSDYLLFAPMTGKNMNRNREKIYFQGKKRGYEFISYISSKASIFPGTNIGDNCFILEDNTIQPFTTVGNNVVLWSGNHIGHHGQIMDHVFFTSHVVLSGHCIVEPYCFFGVNATIRDYTTLGEGTLVAMSASITKDTDAWGVYIGNPARKGPKPSHEVY
jgi:sugar O-acyltransferase (sialic acid O-acetyltransferase NeuD family)